MADLLKRLSAEAQKFATAGPPHIRDLLLEAEVEIVRLRNEMQSFRERIERGVIEMRIGYNATPCEPCHGLGVRMYGSTATWRGGAGGMAITSDVCDRCWGSGNADRPWPSHRKLSREDNARD